MDTNKTLREHISALVDGELPEADAELALAALQERDGKQAWDLYHLTKDTLRDTPAPGLSPGFAKRLAARLALEPAPQPPDSSDSSSNSSASGSNGAAEPVGLAAILANPSSS
ncbi:sigma-E factor negative regulatory protein [Massilia aurea]|uniref:RseA family anti-sigma factor n=1 Tax=Massilia aurea TaxID=373040 RepID=UPI003461AA80